MVDQGPIQPPHIEPTKKLPRLAFDTILSLVPWLGGPLVRIYQFTHPPKTEQAREEWQQVVSKRANEHTDRLDRHEAILRPQEEVTGIGAQLIVGLARHCPDGLGRHRYGPDDLHALAPSAETEATKCAAFELQRLGLANITTVALGEWWLQLTYRFYEQVDPQVMGWSAAEDAKTIGQLVLDVGSGRAATIHQQTAWCLRRFNPAFKCLLLNLPQQYASKERARDYAAASIFLVPETRAALACLAK